MEYKCKANQINTNEHKTEPIWFQTAKTKTNTK